MRVPSRHRRKIRERPAHHVSDPRAIEAFKDARSVHHGFDPLGTHELCGARDVFSHVPQE